jgi:hypothetical protein
VSSCKMEHSMILFGLDQSLVYEEALTTLRPKSPSQLHYKRKCVLDLQGETYTFTMSDIHFEIDFERANISQSIWTDLYIKIKEILQIKNRLTLLCCHFHLIDPDLLSVFHTYMRDTTITYLFLTKHVSYFPSCIKDICTLVSVHTKVVSAYDTHHVSRCEAVVEYMLTEGYDLANARELIYKWMIYNLDIYDCIHYVYTEIYKRTRVELPQEDFLLFMTNYNTRYRSIYHLEYFIHALKRRVLRASCSAVKRHSLVPEP